MSDFTRTEEDENHHLIYEFILNDFFLTGVAEIPLEESKKMKRIYDKWQKEYRDKKDMQKGDMKSDNQKVHQV